MITLVGTFLIEDIFHITGRGLILVGELRGQVAPSHQLVLDATTCWGITGVNYITLRNREGKTGLLIDAPISTRQELLQNGIIGVTAQIFAP